MSNLPRRREYVPGDKVKSLMYALRENPYGIITEMYENNPLDVKVRWEALGECHSRVVDIELVEEFVSKSDRAYIRQYAHEQMQRAREILERY